MCSEVELDVIASEIGFSRPEKFIASLSEIMELRKTSKNMEGWMVRDIATGEHLSKIKTAHYLVTKFLGRMSEGNWKFLMTNKKQFIERNQIDEEFLPLVDYVHENRELFAVMSQEERVVAVRNYFG